MPVALTPAAPFDSAEALTSHGYPNIGAQPTLETAPPLDGVPMGPPRRSTAPISDSCSISMGLDGGMPRDGGLATVFK